MRLAIASLISYLVFVLSILMFGSYLSDREITHYMLKFTIGITSPILVIIFIYSHLYEGKIKTNKFLIDFPATVFYFILIPLIYNIILLFKDLKGNLTSTINSQDFTWIASAFIAAIAFYTSVELLVSRYLGKKN